MKWQNVKKVAALAAILLVTACAAKVTAEKLEAEAKVGKAVAEDLSIP